MSDLEPTGGPSIFRLIHSPSTLDVTNFRREGGVEHRTTVVELVGYCTFVYYKRYYLKRELKTKTNSHLNPSGHDVEGDSSPGQTHKKLRDLSPYDRDDRGCREGGVGVCMLCVCDNEECEDGVGAGVNDTILSETL